MISSKTSAWLACLATLTAVAELYCAQPRSIRSRSGQFTVQGLPPEAAGGSRTSTSSAKTVRLDPTVVTVSCERIKEAVLGTLGLGDRWQGKINVVLAPLVGEDDPIRVISVFYTDGWDYRLEVPVEVEQRRFIKAVVEVLLRELANRRAGPRGTELPPWLAEGLVAHLEAIMLASPALESESRLIRQRLATDTARPAREWLRTHRPLLLDQLNWPTPELLAGDNLQTYRACTQLMVSELLRLKGGRECLVDMLDLLPRYLNWQTAFLRAFDSSFKDMIDFDKWWALTLVSFLGRDQLFLWPVEVCLANLDEILRTPIRVRTSGRDLPFSTQARTQRILQEWDYPEHSRVLRLKINHLQALRLRTPVDYVGLVDGYIEVLSRYLAEGDRAAAALQGSEAWWTELRALQTEVIKRLNLLDAQLSLSRRDQAKR